MKIYIVGCYEDSGVLIPSRYFTVEENASKYKNKIEEEDKKDTWFEPNRYGIKIVETDD